MRSKPAALIGFLLTLPAALLLPIGMLEIEPFYGLLTPLFATDGQRQSVLGLLAILGALMLLPVASSVSLAPIVRNVRAGNRLLAYPSLYLVLAGAILIITATVWGALFIDQLPCFMGVPNCD